MPRRRILASARNAGSPASHQQHHRPRREPDQQPAEGHQRNGVLQQAEGAHHQAQAAGSRPRGARASACRRTPSPRIACRSRVSAFSRIITLTRWPSCARSSDCASEMPRCAIEVAATSSASSATSTQHVAERGRAGAAMQIGGVDHRIDDQRADVGDAGRQDAGDHREPGQRDRERPVGGPDQHRARGGCRRTRRRSRAGGRRRSRASAVRRKRRSVPPRLSVHELRFRRHGCGYNRPIRTYRCMAE